MFFFKIFDIFSAFTTATPTLESIRSSDHPQTNRSLPPPSSGHVEISSISFEFNFFFSFDIFFFSFEFNVSKMMRDGGK